MEIQGIVKNVGSTQEISDKFKKRELIIETSDQYPQTYCVEFTQDKVDLINDIVEGQEVNVKINLRGRSWTNPQGVTKYFTSINGWKIDVVESVAVPTPPQIPTPAEQAAADDDLPF